MKKMFSIQGLEQEFPEAEMNEISGGADPEAAFDMSKIHSNLGGEDIDLEREGSQSLFGDKVDPMRDTGPTPTPATTATDSDKLWDLAESKKGWRKWAGLGGASVIGVTLLLVLILVVFASPDGDSATSDQEAPTGGNTSGAATPYRIKLNKDFSEVGQPGSRSRTEFINSFTKDLAKLLSAGERDSNFIPASSVQVFDVTAGSVVVDFRIAAEQSAQAAVGVSLGQMMSKLNQSLQDGTLQIAGAAALALNETLELGNKIFSDDVEFAFMFASEVGTDGHMGSDSAWVAHGSDKEEDSSSVTTVSDSFRYDYTLGYNIYALTFDIKRNDNLGYQYAYTTIRYRTLTRGSPVDLSSKSHLSCWLRCVGCSQPTTNVQVKLMHARAQATVGPITAQWANYKIPFTAEQMVSVDHVAYILSDAASGSLELALISGSDEVIHTEMPVVATHPPVGLPLQDCEYFHKHFATNHIEWAYFNIDAKIPEGSHPNLFATDGTGAVLKESLDITDTKLRQIGFFSYNIQYELKPNGYGYSTINYRGERKDQPTTVDVSNFGSHVCLWLKGEPDSHLRVELFSDASAASKWTVLISHGDWQHYCLALADMSSSQANPVDLSRLMHVFVSDVSSPIMADQRSYSVALISFANDATTYSVFPATMDPYIAVETNKTTGNCVDVVGPAATSEVPPPQVPAERYTQISDYIYNGNDRSRLAVYLFKTDSKWLALAHSLKTMGIPFFLTTDIIRALQFDTVLVYPFAPRRAQEAELLNAHMAAGNTVIFGMMTTPLYNAQCSPRVFNVERTTEMSYISFINDELSQETRRTEQPAANSRRAEQPAASSKGAEQPAASSKIPRQARPQRTLAAKVKAAMKQQQRRADQPLRSSRRATTCTWPQGTSGYSVITKQSASIGAKEVYGALHIGVDLGTSEANTQKQIASHNQKKTYVGGTISGKNWQFKGGETNTASFSFANFESLATNVNSKSGQYKVYIVNQGGSYSWTDACHKTVSTNDYANTEEDNGKTLVVFKDAGTICLGKSSYGRKFGPTVLAPFARVVIKNNVDFVDGTIIARSVGSPSGGSQNQLHGDLYSGSLECEGEVVEVKPFPCNDDSKLMQVDATALHS